MRCSLSAWVQLRGVRRVAANWRVSATAQKLTQTIESQTEASKHATPSPPALCTRGFGGGSGALLEHGMRSISVRTSQVSEESVVLGDVRALPVAGPWFPAQERSGEVESERCCSITFARRRQSERIRCGCGAGRASRERQVQRRRRTR